MDPQYLDIFLALMAFGAFAQGFMGLGFGIIVMAGMAFTPWNLERTAAPITIVLPLVLLAIIFAAGKDSKIHIKPVLLVLAGELAGIPLGYWFLNVCGDQPVFTLLLGLALVAMVVNQLVRPRFDRPLFWPLGILAGLIGGLFTAAFTSGGPIIALFVYSQYKNPAEAKVTLQVTFLCTMLWRLVNVELLGKGLGPEVLKVAAISLPVVIFFSWVGHQLSRKAPSIIFSRIVFGFIGLTGVMHIVKYFF